jgi:hypothetical protein
MATTMTALIAYVIAFVQHQQAEADYRQYVVAYQECAGELPGEEFNHSACNYIPEVRVHLAAHREAIAVGEPFFNLALSLTAALLVLPLLRRLAARLSSAAACCAGNGTA